MTKTNCDIPEWDCQSCRYSGPDVFDFGDKPCVECRRNHPGNTGFPIMSVNSWCWDGRLSSSSIEKGMRALARDFAERGPA